MECMGIDVDDLKNDISGAFAIPSNRKELVKELLNAYTSKPMKRARKQQHNQIGQELEAIVKAIEGIVTDRFDRQEQHVQLSHMYMKTRVIIDKAIKELQITALSRITSDVDTLRKTFDPKRAIQRTINESDKIALINYYTALLKNASEQFRAIVEYVDDFRSSEISDISSMRHDRDPELRVDNFADYLDNEMEDIQWVLMEAVQAYKDEQDRL